MLFLDVVRKQFKFLLGLFKFCLISSMRVGSLIPAEFSCTFFERAKLLPASDPLGLENSPCPLVHGHTLRATIAVVALCTQCKACAYHHCCHHLSLFPVPGLLPLRHFCVWLFLGISALPPVLCQLPEGSECCVAMCARHSRHNSWTSWIDCELWFLCL